MAETAGTGTEAPEVAAQARSGGRVSALYSLPFALCCLPVPAQRDTEELLDLGAGTARERAESLADLRRLNRWLGGIAATRREVAALARRRGLAELRLLDLGTGSADVPAALERAGPRMGVR